MRRVSSSTTSSASASPARAAPRPQAPRRRRRERSAPVRVRQPASEVRIAGAAGSALRSIPIRARGRSPRRRRVPRCSSRWRTTPAPSPVPTERKTKSSTPRAIRTTAAESGEVDVVLEGHGHRAAARAGSTLMPSSRHPPLRDLAAPGDHARNPDHRSVDRAVADVARRDQALLSSQPRPSPTGPPRRAAPRPAGRGSRRPGRRSRRAGSERRGPTPAPRLRRERARRRSRRSSARRRSRSPRAPDRRLAASEARLTPSASRCPLLSRSSLARSGRHRGSHPERSAR